MTKRKRVLLLGPSRLAAGGVSTHLNQIFSSAIAKDFDLHHFQVGSEGRRESRAGMICRLLISPITLSITIIRYFPSIVHLNMSMGQKSYWRDLVYLIISKLMGQRVVFQIHGGLLPQELFSHSKLLTRLLRVVLRHCDIIVLLARTELNAYREFVPKARLELIANAIEVEGVIKKNTTPKPGPLKVVYVGRLIKTKGINEVIEAFYLLSKENRKIQLTIAGSGQEKANLQNRVTELGLDEFVVFAGEVFGAQKNKIWHEADLFVFPTYHKEGLPYSVLESMAAGTPIITTRVGALPDIIEEGVHGFFVPAKDPEALAESIARLDSDRELLALMSSAARDRVIKEYSLSRLANDFQRLYNSL